jgi:hypothetical protein
MHGRAVAQWLLLLAAGVALTPLGGCGGRLIGSTPALEGDADGGPAGPVSNMDGAVEPLLGDASTGIHDGAPFRPDARARRDAAASALADAGLRDPACTWGLTQADQQPSAGDFPGAIASADFDGDGHLDLAITAEEVGTTNTSDVAILLGNGDGSFQPAVTYTAGRGSSALAVGDLNNDGIPDLAVANVANGVSILLGEGDGTFEAAVQYASEADAQGVAIADLNGDGVADIALGSYGGVIVLLGNGDGTLRESATYSAGRQPYAVAIADLNHDGHPDLVAAETGNQNVEVLLGNGDGTFQGAIASLAAGDPASVAVADLDGDGNPDVAVPGFTGMTTLLGSGDGTFHDRALQGGPTFQASTSIADVDRDGHLDLVTGNTEMGAITIALGNGQGVFQNTLEMLGTSFYGVTIGDFNEDGWPDIAAPDLHGTLYVLLGGCVP